MTALIIKYWKEIGLVSGGLLTLILTYFKGRSVGKEKGSRMISDLTINTYEKIAERDKEDHANREENKKNTEYVVGHSDSGFVDESSMLD